MDVDQFLSEFVASALTVRPMVRDTGLGSVTSLTVHEDDGSVWVEVVIALGGKHSGARARRATLAFSPTSGLDPNPNLRGAIFATGVVERLHRMWVDRSLTLATGECFDLPPLNAGRAESGPRVEP
jgi:hypothetical protein